MPRREPWDVIGGAYSDDARPWSVQDTVNYLVVMAERGGTRTPKMLRGAPGLVTFSASMPESPVRGLYVAEGRLFAVVGTTLYSIGTDGAATSLGTIPGVARCVFTHNQVTGGNQVVIGNGQSGYVYDTVAGTLEQITDDGFPGLRSVDFIDQYVIGVEPFGRYWSHSDLADAKSYSTLDRAEAEKAPDRIMQAIVIGSDVLVLGERTGQFFANTGAATGTFQNRPGTELNIGAASPWTACRLDNTVYWLGNDGSVYRLAGYQAQRISTHALEQAISRSGMADAYAFTFEDQGHKCYLLTFPDGMTWCYDAGSGEWTRRESYGLNRWRVSALVKWGRHWIAGDYVNGRLYQLDWRVQNEAGEPLERRRVTGILHDDQNRLIVNGVEFLFDTGMDQDSPPLPETITAALTMAGDVPDGYVGDAVSGAYTVTGGVLPYGSVTVTSGTFPPGLTLNADGTYSGTLTTAGDYSWTVGVTDADGNTATLADTATVTRLRWYLLRDGVADVWSTNNITAGSWTATTRTPALPLGYVDPIQVAVGKAIFRPRITGVTDLFVTSDLDGVIAGSLSTAMTYTLAVRVAADGVVTASREWQHSAYWYSTDYGATFTSNTIPANSFGASVPVKVGSRWVIGIRSDTNLIKAGWTDSALPNIAAGAWNQVVLPYSATASVPGCLLSNGNRAFLAHMGGRIMSTEDGASWSVVYNHGGAFADLRDTGLASGDLVVFVPDQSGGLLVSTDGGATFTARNTGVVDVVVALSFAQGVLVASFSASTTPPRYSTDYGATWANVPGIPASSGTYGIGALIG